MRLMFRVSEESREFVRRILFGNRALRATFVASLLLGAGLNDAQDTPQNYPSAPTSVEKQLVPGVVAIVRHTEKLQVPRKGRASISVDAVLSAWSTVSGSREFTVPAQGFYIATLENGPAITVINGDEKMRQSGDIWAVQDGQTMTMRIQDPKQESLSCEIFSIRASR